MVSDIKRHDLLWINEEGLAYARTYAFRCNPGMGIEPIDSTVISSIPAIVRRQETADKTVVDVGFSSCCYNKSGRIRISAQIPASSIVKRMTPLEVAEMAPQFTVPAKLALEAILRAARRCRLMPGVYGSAALYMVTGLPYFRQDSDLDIMICKQEGGALWPFYQTVVEIEQSMGVKADVEVQWQNYGIKLKELFSGQKTVLAKGLYHTDLVYIKDIGHFSQDMADYKKTGTV